MHFKFKIETINTKILQTCATALNDSLPQTISFLKHTSKFVFTKRHSTKNRYKCTLAARLLNSKVRGWYFIGPLDGREWKVCLWLCTCSIFQTVQEIYLKLDIHTYVVNIKNPIDFLTKSVNWYRISGQSMITLFLHWQKTIESTDRLQNWDQTVKKSNPNLNGFWKMTSSNKISLLIKWC